MSDKSFVRAVAAIFAAAFVSCGGGVSTDDAGMDVAADVADVADDVGSDTQADVADDAADDATVSPIDVSGWGSYAVGYKLFQTTDAMRGDRSVPIAVYYPAMGVAAQSDTVVQCSFDNAFLANQVSVEGLGADAPVGGFPVLVFSHGSGGSKEMYKYLLEFLASHGYVVVAPDHTGNVGFGQLMPEDMEMTSLRVTDLLWVIDWLGSAVNDEAGALHGLADMNRLAVAGHSYGGHIVMALGGASWDWPHIAEQCAMDEPPDPYVCSLQNHVDDWPSILPSDKVKAVISLAHDASEVHFGTNCAGAADIGVPVMYMGGTADTIAVFDTNAQLCFDNGSSPACLVKLSDAGHLDFTDSMAEGTMSCDRSHHLVRGMVLAFLERYINGDAGADPVLRGDAAAWDDTSDFQSSCR